MSGENFCDKHNEERGGDGICLTCWHVGKAIREERVKIIMWLRDDKVGVGPTECERWIADAIERGEHLK